MAAHTISYQVQPDSALTRTASLETFRLAVLGCRRPFWAERARTGSAAARAAAASALLPVPIASSTFRISVLRRERPGVFVFLRRTASPAALFCQRVVVA